MTPEEKAKELINKFAIYLRANLMYDEDADEDAKQCSLIAVDEIIKETLLHDETTYQHGRTSFWKEVKQEIEKL
jgi:hypothetical protein